MFFPLLSHWSHEILGSWAFSLETEFYAFKIAKGEKKKGKKKKKKKRTSGVLEKSRRKKDQMSWKKCCVPTFFGNLCLTISALSLFSSAKQLILFMEIIFKPFSTTWSIEDCPRAPRWGRALSPILAASLLSPEWQLDKDWQTFKVTTVTNLGLSVA